MKNVLFIGMDPAHHGDPTKPLEGPIGLRLAKLLKMEREHFIRSFDRINLNRLPLDTFSKTEAELTVRKILRTRKYTKLVLLGRVVAECFDLKYKLLDTFSIGHGKSVLLLPHPSGLNRFWNDRQNFDAAGAHLRDFVYG